MRGGIKAARPVQHIAEEIEPDRPAITRRIDVDDTAPDGIIAGFHHGGGLRKPHADKKAAQCLFVDALADACGEGGLSQHVPRGDILRRGVQRGQQDEAIRHCVNQRGQCRHTRCRDVGIGRDPIIGQAIPSRKAENRHRRREEVQRIADLRQPLVVASNMQDGRGAALQLLQDQPGVVAFGRATHGDMIARGGIGICHS